MFACQPDVVPSFSMSSPEQVQHAPGRSDRVDARDRSWERTLLRTPWLTAGDDLGEVLRTALAEVPDPAARPGDVLAVAEKVAVVTSGLEVPGALLTPGQLARALARAVRPVGDSMGLSVPEKMHYVLREVGLLRMTAAVLAAAVTRPFGRTGAFFRVAGPVARDVDGMRGAYPDTLLPPLTPGQAAVLAHHLSTRVGRCVAIVDINDRGGSIRAVSAGGPAPEVLLAALRDNPQGHLRECIPVVLLRAA